MLFPVVDWSQKVGTGQWTRDNDLWHCLVCDITGSDRRFVKGPRTRRCAITKHHSSNSKNRYVVIKQWPLLLILDLAIGIAWVKLCIHEFRRRGKYKSAILSSLETHWIWPSPFLKIQLQNEDFYYFAGWGTYQKWYWEASIICSFIEYSYIGAPYLFLSCTVVITCILIRDLWPGLQHSSLSAWGSDVHRTTLNVFPYV